MLVVMKRNASKEDVNKAKEKVLLLGYHPHEVPGANRVTIGITGNRGKIDTAAFSVMSVEGIK